MSENVVSILLEANAKLDGIKQLKEQLVSGQAQLRDMASTASQLQRELVASQKATEAKTRALAQMALRQIEAQEAQAKLSQQIRQTTQDTAEVTKKGLSLSNLMKAGLGINVATKSAELLRGEIAYVIKNIEDIPGVPSDTRESIIQMREDFSDLRNAGQQVIASLASGFSQMGQGIGYGIGALIYGQDVAAEAMANDTRLREENRRAIERQKEAEKAAIELKKQEAQAAKELEAALKKLSDIRNDQQSSTEKYQRLLAEADSLALQAINAKGTEKQRLLAESQIKELEANRALGQIANERMAAEAQMQEYQLSKLPLDEREKQIKADLERIEESLAILDSDAVINQESITRLINLRLLKIKELDTLEAAKLAKQKEEAANLRAQAREQSDIAKLQINSLIEQIRHNQSLASMAPESVGKRARMLELFDAEKRAMQDLIELAVAYAGTLKEGTLEHAQALKAIQDLQFQKDKVGSGYVPQKSKFEQSQENYTSLSDPTKHYQGAGEGIAGGAMDYLAQVGTLGDQLHQQFLSLANTITQSVGNSISGLIQKTMTWGQALRNIGMSIVQGIINSIAQMAAQWIVSQILMLTVGKTLQAASLASVTPLAMAATALWSPAAVAASIATYGTALANGPMAMAQIKGAALMGAFSEGGYTGTGSVDQPAGIVHRGEVVFSQKNIAALGGVGVVEGIRLGSIPIGMPQSIATMTLSGSDSQGQGIMQPAKPPAIYVFTDPNMLARAVERDTEHEAFIVNTINNNRDRIRIG